MWSPQMDLHVWHLCGHFLPTYGITPCHMLRCVVFSLLLVTRTWWYWMFSLWPRNVFLRLSTHTVSQQQQQTALVCTYEAAIWMRRNVTPGRSCAAWYISPWLGRERSQTDTGILGLYVINRSSDLTRSMYVCRELLRAAANECVRQMTQIDSSRVSLYEYVPRTTAGSCVSRDMCAYIISQVSVLCTAVRNEEVVFVFCPNKCEPQLLLLPLGYFLLSYNMDPCTYVRILCCMRGMHRPVWRCSIATAGWWSRDPSSSSLL